MPLMTSKITAHCVQSDFLLFWLGLHRVVLCTVSANAVQAGECDLCVQIVSAVEEYVAQGLTPDEILAEIEGLCEGNDRLTSCILIILPRLVTCLSIVL